MQKPTTIQSPKLSTRSEFANTPGGSGNICSDIQGLWYGAYMELSLGNFPRLRKSRQRFHFLGTLFFYLKNVTYNPSKIPQISPPQIVLFFSGRDGGPPSGDLIVGPLDGVVLRPGHGSELESSLERSRFSLQTLESFI